MPITKWGPTTRDKKKRQATFDWNPLGEYVDGVSDYSAYDDFSYPELIDVLAKAAAKLSTAAAKAVDDVIAKDLKEGSVEFEPQWWD